MNIKLMFGAIALFGISGVVVVTVFDMFGSESIIEPVPEFEITRPAVKPIPNTFSIMTPEEKVAADEAARLAAEVALLASTSASTTATSTASTTAETAEE